MLRIVKTRRVALACGATLAALAVVLPWQPSLRDVRLEMGGGLIEIGAVRIGFDPIGAALAQAPGALTLTDLSFTAAGATYRAPRAEFTGVSLSRAELTALIDPAGSEPVAQRLVRLSARQVTIPELVVEQSIGGERTLTVYREVVLADIVQGRVGSLKAAGGSLTGSGGAGPSSGTYGALSVTDLDLAAVAALYTERAGPAAPLRRLYGTVTLADIALRDAKGMEIRIARGEGRDVLARPTPESWTETLRALAEAGPPDQATPEQRSRAMKALAEMAEAFEIGRMELTGLSLRDSSAAASSEVRLARVAYASTADGQPAGVKVEGIDVAAPNGTVRMGSLSLTGFSLARSFRALADLAHKAPDGYDAAELRRLAPTLGTIRMADLAFDVADERPAPAGPERIRFTVAAVELTADRQLNAIPTNLRLAVDHLALTLPPDSQDEGIRNLLDLGYRNVDLSTLVAADWSEGQNELALREVSVRGVNMGSVTVRGTLGNVGRDVFSPDTAAATVALLGATAKTLTLVVENNGLFEAIVTAEARRQGKPADTVRREYASAAALGIPAVLGNSSAAKAIGQAVGRFVAKPGRLTISARSKEPAGLGFADFAGLGQPTDILNRLDVTALAE